MFSNLRAMCTYHHDTSALVCEPETSLIFILLLYDSGLIQFSGGMTERQHQEEEEQ